MIRRSQWSTGVAAACLLVPGLAAAEPVDEVLWERLLSHHVRSSGEVAYEPMQGERPQLERYLEQLGQAQPEAWPKAEQLAFWINAYNAAVVKGVLDYYPIRSVREVPGFFTKRRYQVGGELLSLHAIENRVRGFGEWRAHFALVDGTRSSPPLAPTPYRTATLDRQLAAQTARVLADPSRGLRFDPPQRAVQLSTVFSEFRADFLPKGSLTVERLVPVLEPYLAPDVAALLEYRRWKLAFLPKDWALNNRTP